MKGVKKYMCSGTRYIIHPPPEHRSIKPGAGQPGGVQRAEANTKHPCLFIIFLSIGVRQTFDICEKSGRLPVSHLLTIKEHVYFFFLWILKIWLTGLLLISNRACRWVVSLLDLAPLLLHSHLKIL